MLLTARYVLPISTPHIEDGAILVREGRIEDVGRSRDLVERHPGEPRRDFGIAAILPGFVDLHTHLEYSAMRGLVDDLPYADWKIALDRQVGVLEKEDWQDAANLGALEAVRSGITTIADITDSGAAVLAGSTAGLRGIIYREVSTMRVSEIQDVMSAAREDLLAWKEDADASDLLIAGIAPHGPYTCHPRLFREVADIAIEEGYRVATHMAGSRDEYAFVKYGSSRLATELLGPPDSPSESWLPTGVSPVQYLLQWGLFEVPHLLAVHAIQVDGADIDVLASNHVSIASCPRCSAKLGMGTAPLHQFVSRGMRVGLGTDSPASNNTIDFFDEMRIGLLLQRAVYNKQEFLGAELFVRMATLEGACALGLDDRIGSLEVGKAADIIAVDLSHSHQAPLRNPYGALVHTCNQEDVLFTMVDGSVLYDAGVYKTLDHERIVRRADEVRSKILA